MPGPRFVIVGAGQAGVSLASNLAQNHWPGPIVIIGDEPHPPYQRPPLSKGLLAGTDKLDDIVFRPLASYEQHGIELRLGVPATAVDREARTLELADGSRLGYDRLALCTGARPRVIGLPGASLPGVRYLRTFSDLKLIRDQVTAGARVVIVGAGYTGLEVASVLVRRGAQVTVLEAADRVLQRAAGPPVSAFYERVHREEGVDVRTGAELAGFAGTDRVSGVMLSDGTSVPAGTVIVSVGILPQVDLARDCGLAVENGIVVDERCLTIDQDIFAAGDCASRWDPRLGRHVRHESVPNAMEHARLVAAVACGKPPPQLPGPWFWSDQYDLRLQIAGVSRGHDDIVIRGDSSAGRSFVAWYLRAGSVIAADCVNRPREFMIARRLLDAGASLDRELLADESANLAAQLKAALAR